MIITRAFKRNDKGNLIEPLVIDTSIGIQKKSVKFFSTPYSITSDGTSKKFNNIVIHLNNAEPAHIVCDQIIVNGVKVDSAEMIDNHLKFEE